jgi:transposase InsO family protein
MTDNGKAYRSQDFRDASTTTGVPHLRTRPYTPRSNGKAARSLQTVVRECAYTRTSNRHWSEPPRCRAGLVGRVHATDG